MKKTANILLIFLVTVIFAGCTHNDGNIGDWFGTWKLENILIDGSVDSDYSGNVLWKFQNSVISMVAADDEHHAIDARYGSWSESDGRLLLDFSHSDDNTSSGTGYYAPLAETHIPSGKTELTIVNLSSSRLELRYASPEGKVYAYKLKKWG